MLGDIYRTCFDPLHYTQAFVEKRIPRVVREHGYNMYCEKD